MIDYEQLPHTLRNIRLNRGFSQQSIANVLHVARSTYSYYELGTTRPKIETLQQLSRIFNVPLELFLDGEWHPEIPDMKANPVRTSRRWKKEIDTSGNLSPQERSLIVLIRSSNISDICSKIQGFVKTLAVENE